MSSPAPLDFSSQQVLVAYFNDIPASEHLDVCFNAVAPMTAELAHALALGFVVRNKAQRCRDVLDSFFGAPLLLPEPGTSADTIYSSSVPPHAHTCRFGDDCDNAEQVKGSEEAARTISAATFTRLVCCRAEAASILDEQDAPQWWRTAMVLYDAFLSTQSPLYRLDRICAFDLYRYRDNQINYPSLKREKRL